MPRNSYKSHNGRSAVARKIMFSGPGQTNGIFPQGYIKDSKGDSVRKGYFGGNTKGGAAPSATGFMIPPGSIAATQVATAPSRPNYLFVFRSSNRGPGLTYLGTGCNCPLPRPLPLFNYQLYFYAFTNLVGNNTPDLYKQKLAEALPPLISFPAITYEQALFIGQNGIPNSPELAYNLIPQKNLQFWQNLYSVANQYGPDAATKLGSINQGLPWGLDFGAGSAPINLEITTNLYGNEIIFNSPEFNLMQPPVSVIGGPGSTTNARNFLLSTQDPLFLGIYIPDQYNIITSQFNSP